MDCLGWVQRVPLCTVQNNMEYRMKSGVNMRDKFMEKAPETAGNPIPKSIWPICRRVIIQRELIVLHTSIFHSNPSIPTILPTSTSHFTTLLSFLLYSSLLFSTLLRSSLLHRLILTAAATTVAEAASSQRLILFLLNRSPSKFMSLFLGRYFTN